MSSFFDFNRPKMFDVKKKLGIVEKEEKNDTSSHVSGNESWVELAPSRGSLCSSVDVGMVMVDDMNIGGKDSRLSPVSVQSPHLEFESLEQVKYKLVRDMLPPGKNTDWIWDWSSRPEALPPKCVRMRQYGSNLTTPPNSPEPELLAAFPIDRKDRASYLSMNMFVGFIVSNLVTLVIGAAIGFAVCRRLAKQKEI
ncbi:dct-1 [Pristionchus pacificus]|uniref:Dct-1 n=1 Tax=Pristionchus pacificus TaxID=54126 RepID=A0A2A6CTW5_PRIPA|nr:dct-1 [Pristionchus pacificus]|eukprot:PDM81558.1 dct-1 [Pristionchus pacificus]